MTNAPLSDRGTSVCRGCASTTLAPVLDLGEQPLANELSSTQDGEDERFLLHLRICTACGLGQLGEFVLPERIFGDYPYLSSVSSSWIAHARAYAESMCENLPLDSRHLVVEVASNDGYLLRAFQTRGVNVLGIEPARNVAELARQTGVPTMSEFFGRNLAQEIVSEHGHPRLVAANNVYAHVPDLEDFTAGLAALCDSSTVVTIENPSFMTLLAETQFDTIYHEHFSYLTAHSVQAAIARHDLELVRVDKLATHGGSNRYWLRRIGTSTPHPSVSITLELERSQGLFDPSCWERFARVSRGAISGLREWLDERAGAGARVVGYGAAAKGNTLMNAAQVSRQDILAVADASKEKQGRYLPGSRIPVVAQNELPKCDPSDVLILPWNIASELSALVADQLPSARHWVAVPCMRRIDTR